MTSFVLRNWEFIIKSSINVRNATQIRVCARDVYFNARRDIQSGYRKNQVPNFAVSITLVKINRLNLLDFLNLTLYFQIYNCDNIFIINLCTLVRMNQDYLKLKLYGVK